MNSAARILCCATLLAAPAVMAEDPATVSIIKTGDLIDKMKISESERKFSLIDVRSRVEFEESHIDGAANLPARLFKEKLAAFVKDKDRELVLYCGAPVCFGKVKQAADDAAALGYKKVRAYEEGLAAWGMAKQRTAGKQLAVAEPTLVSSMEVVEALKKKGDLFIVDVRDPEDFTKFHLKDSVNIPVDELASKAKQLPSKPTIVVCQAGGQSAAAGRLLESLGRKDVKVLKGGLLRWKEAGLPFLDAAAPAK
ncbi:MAG: rhodanese-like domain-containing protein [Elusimicrobia bacterium]|nr:rhodanese-like domain-containing protein [Elusimicrobiota bacterium]